MTRYLCAVDNGKPWETDVNLLAEILDNTEPNHSRSKLSIRKINGLMRSPKGWELEAGPARVYWWDDFENEWSR